jgi:uncharacterized SAM-binding protein YcdF (DUF218 family)
MQKDEKQIDTDARIIWDYLQLHQTPKKSDAIFVFCSMDTRVAERAAELFNQGMADTMLISGGLGKLSKNVFDTSEAEVFSDIVKNLGVPADRIITEGKATNTGENILFTFRLLQEKNIMFNSFILVQKPYMERRTYAAFMKQWPRSQVNICVTSPQISYGDYFNAMCPRELVLNVMVGDLQRIKVFPKLGFQIEQDIPTKVWGAYKALVAQGYDKHLLKDLPVGLING